MNPKLKTVTSRPTLARMLETRKSMLNEALPLGYGAIETTQEALHAASPTTQVTLRIHIVWDNPANTLDLQRLLDHMRETGAAMVKSVEEVS